MTSPAQAAANQGNSQFSTGPKTPEGKKRASLNARTHGLTAQTLVLPGEDPKQLERLEWEYIKTWNPRTPIERDLLLELAHLRWKQGRGDRAETAQCILRMADAPAAFDAAEAIRVQDLFNRVISPGEDDDTVKLVAELQRSEPGVELMLRYWRQVLDLPEWYTGYRDTMIRLIGKRPEWLHDDDEVMTVIVDYQFAEGLDRDYRATNGFHETYRKSREHFLADAFRAASRTTERWRVPIAVKAWTKRLPKNKVASERLEALVRAEIARLEALLPRLRQVTASRHELATQAAVIDGSKEGVVRQRYATALRRAYDQALKALERQIKLRSQLDEMEDTEEGEEEPAPDLAPEVVEMKQDAPIESDEEFELRNEPAAGPFPAVEGPEGASGPVEEVQTERGATPG